MEGDDYFIVHSSDVMVEVEDEEGEEFVACEIPEGSVGLDQCKSCQMLFSIRAIICSFYKYCCFLPSGRSLNKIPSWL